MEVARRGLVQVLRGALQYYSVALLALVALALLGASPFVGARIAWLGIAWMVLAATVFALSRQEEAPIAWSPRSRTILLTLGILVVAALVLRAVPQSKAPVPIGYDYGFYKASMDAYDSAAPAVPEKSLAPWIKVQFEPGLLILQETLHQVAGLDAGEHLRWLWPLFSSLLLVPLYATTRAFLGRGAGLTAAAFYVASYAQFTVHEYLYEKNVLALALFLVLLFLVREQRWVLAGLALGGLGIWHRPTFLLAAATLALVGAYDIVRRRAWRGWTLAAAVSLPCFLPLWILRSHEYFGLAFRVVQNAGDNVGLAVPEGGGTFLSFLQYQSAAITYLPLALAGAVLLVRRRSALLPAVAFALCFLNVALQLVFFNRFIIMLDLVSFLLVAAAFIAATPTTRPWIRPTALVVLLVLTAIPTLHAASQSPGPPFLWIDGPQHEAILGLHAHLPANATLLADNLVSPYLAADSGLRTYGPGLFDDPHTNNEWRLFFASDNDTDIRGFLDAYPRPLYVFHAEGTGPGLGTGKFHEPLFTLVRDEGGAKVWRYNDA